MADSSNNLISLTIGIKNLDDVEKLDALVKNVLDNVDTLNKKVLTFKAGNNNVPTTINDAKLPPVLATSYPSIQGPAPSAKSTSDVRTTAGEIASSRQLASEIAGLRKDIRQQYVDKKRPGLDEARMAAIVASVPSSRAGSGISYSSSGIGKFSGVTPPSMGDKEMRELLAAHRKAQEAVNQDSSRLLDKLRQYTKLVEGAARLESHTLPALLSNLTTLQSNIESDIRATRKTRVPLHRAVPIIEEELVSSRAVPSTKLSSDSLRLARIQEERIAKAMTRLEKLFTETFIRGKAEGRTVLSPDVVEKLNTGFKVLSKSVDEIADAYNTGDPQERNRATAQFRDAKLQRSYTPSGDFSGLEFRTLNVDQLRRIASKHLGERPISNEFEIAKALGDLKKKLKTSFKKEIESAVVSFPVPTLAASDRGAQLVYTGQKGPIRSNPVEFVELRTGIDRLVAAIASMERHSKERPLALRDKRKETDIKSSILKGEVLEPEFDNLFKVLNAGGRGDIAKGEIEAALRRAIAYRAGQAKASEFVRQNVYEKEYNAQMRSIPKGATEKDRAAADAAARVKAARAASTSTQAGDFTRIHRTQQEQAKEVANNVYLNLEQSGMGLERLLALSRDLGITGTAVTRHLSVAKGQNIAEKMLEALTAGDGKSAPYGTEMSTAMGRAFLNLVQLRNRPQNIPKAQSNFARPITKLMEDVEPFDEQILAENPSEGIRLARLRRAHQNKRALQQVHITTREDIGRVTRSGGRNSYGLFEKGFSVQTEVEDILRELNDIDAFGPDNTNLSGIRHVAGRSLSEEVAAKIGEGRDKNEIVLKRVRGSVRDLVPYARATGFTRRSEQPLSGIGPDLPYLRTVEGQQAIDAGTIGPSVYNTVTEYRTTPETFEDQKIIRTGSRLGRSLTGGIHSLVRDINEKFIGRDGKIIDREAALKRVYKTGDFITSSLGSPSLSVDKKDVSAMILDVIESKIKQGSTVDEGTVLQLLNLFQSQQGKKVALQTGDKGVVTFKEDLGSQLLPKTPYQSLSYLSAQRKMSGVSPEAIKTARRGARNLGNFLYWDESDIKDMQMTLPEFREEGKKETRTLSTEELLVEIRKTKAAINSIFGEEINSIAAFREKVKKIAGEDNEDALYTKRPIDMVTSEAAIARRGLRAEMVAAAATALTGETPLVIGNEDPDLLKRVISKYGRATGFHAEGGNLPILSEAVGGPNRAEGRQKSLIAKVPVTEFAALRPQEGVESDKFLRFNPNTFAAFRTAFGENSAVFKELSKASEGVSLRFYEMFKVMIAMDAELAKTSPQLAKYREAVVNGAKAVEATSLTRLGADSFSSAYDLIGSVHDTTAHPETLKIPISAALRRGNELPEFVVVPSAAARGTFQTSTGSVGQDQLGRAVTNVVNALQEYHTGEAFPKTALTSGVEGYGSKLKALIDSSYENPEQAKRISDEIDRVAKESVTDKDTLGSIVDYNFSAIEKPEQRRTVLLRKISELENYFVRGRRPADPHSGGIGGRPAVFSELAKLYQNESTRPQGQAAYEQLARVFSDSSSRLGFKGIGFRPGEESNPAVAEEVQHGIRGLMNAVNEQVFGKGSIFHTGTSELRYPTMMLPITNRQVNIGDQLSSFQDLNKKILGSDMSNFAELQPHLDKLTEEAQKVKTTSLETVEMHEDRLKELLNNMVKSGFTDEETSSKLLEQASKEGIGSFVTRFPITDFKSFQGRILKTHNRDDERFTLRIAGGLSQASREAALDPDLIKFEGGRAVGGKLVDAKNEIIKKRSELLAKPVGDLTEVDKTQLKDLNLRYTALSKAILALTNTFHSMTMAADFDGDKFFVSLMAGTDAQKELVRSVTKLAKGYEMVNGKPVLVTDFNSELQDQQMSSKGPKIRGGAGGAASSAETVLDTIDSLFINEQLPGFFSGRKGKEDEINAPAYGMMENLRDPNAKMAIADAFKTFILQRGGEGNAPESYEQQGRMAYGEVALRGALEKVGVSLPSRPIVLGSIGTEETQKNLDAMASEAVDQLEAKSTILKLAGPKLLTGPVTESTNTVVRLLEAEQKRDLSALMKKHGVAINSEQHEALLGEFGTRESAFQHTSAGVIQEALSTKFGKIPEALRLLNALNAPREASEADPGQTSFDAFLTSLNEGGGFESLNEPTRANKAAREEELAKLSPEKLQQRLLAFARIREQESFGSTLSLKGANGAFRSFSAKQIEEELKKGKAGTPNMFSGENGITSASIIEKLSSEYSPRETIELMREILERNTVSSVSDKMVSREFQLRRGGKTQKEARGVVLEQIAKTFGFLNNFNPDLPAMAKKLAELRTGGVQDLSTASIREIVAAAVRVKGPRVFETVSPIRPYANKDIERLRQILGYTGGDEESAEKAKLTGGVTANFLQSIIKAVNPTFATADVDAVKLSHEGATKYLTDYNSKIGSLRTSVLKSLKTSFSNSKILNEEGLASELDVEDPLALKELDNEIDLMFKRIQLPPKSNLRTLSQPTLFAREKFMRSVQGSGASQEHKEALLSRFGMSDSDFLALDTLPTEGMEHFDKETGVNTAYAEMQKAFKKDPNRLLAAEKRKLRVLLENRKRREAAGAEVGQDEQGEFYSINDKEIEKSKLRISAIKNRLRLEKLNELDRYGKGGSNILELHRLMAASGGDTDTDREEIEKREAARASSEEGLVPGGPGEGTAGGAGGLMNDAQFKALVELQTKMLQILTESNHTLIRLVEAVNRERTRGGHDYEKSSAAISKKFSGFDRASIDALNSVGIVPERPEVEKFFSELANISGNNLYLSPTTMSNAVKQGDNLSLSTFRSSKSFLGIKTEDIPEEIQASLGFEKEKSDPIILGNAIGKAYTAAAAELKSEMHSDEENLERAREKGLAMIEEVISTEHPQGGTPHLRHTAKEIFDKSIENEERRALARNAIGSELSLGISGSVPGAGRYSIKGKADLMTMEESQDAGIPLLGLYDVKTSKKFKGEADPSALLNDKNSPYRQQLMLYGMALYELKKRVKDKSPEEREAAIRAHVESMRPVGKGVTEADTKLFNEDRLVAGISDYVQGHRELALGIAPLDVPSQTVTVSDDRFEAFKVELEQNIIKWQAFIKEALARLARGDTSKVGLERPRSRFEGGFDREIGSYRRLGAYTPDLTAGGMEFLAHSGLVAGPDDLKVQQHLNMVKLLRAFGTKAVKSPNDYLFSHPDTGIYGQFDTSKGVPQLNANVFPTIAQALTSGMLTTGNEFDEDKLFDVLGGMEKGEKLRLVSTLAHEGGHLALSKSFAGKYGEGQFGSRALDELLNGGEGEMHGLLTAQAKHVIGTNAISPSVQKELGFEEGEIGRRKMNEALSKGVAEFVQTGKAAPLETNVAEEKVANVYKNVLMTALEELLVGVMVRTSIGLSAPNLGVLADKNISSSVLSKLQRTAQRAVDPTRDDSVVSKFSTGKRVLPGYSVSERLGIPKESLAEMTDSQLEALVATANFGDRVPSSGYSARKLPSVARALSRSGTFTMRLGELSSAGPRGKELDKNDRNRAFTSNQGKLRRVMGLIEALGTPESQREELEFQTVATKKHARWLSMIREQAEKYGHTVTETEEDGIVSARVARGEGKSGVIARLPSEVDKDLAKAAKRFQRPKIVERRARFNADRRAEASYYSDQSRRASRLAALIDERERARAAVMFTDPEALVRKYASGQGGGDDEEWDDFLMDKIRGATRATPEEAAARHGTEPVQVRDKKSTNHDEELQRLTRDTIPKRIRMASEKFTREFNKYFPTSSQYFKLTDTTDLESSSLFKLLSGQKAGLTMPENTKKELLQRLNEFRSDAIAYKEKGGTDKESRERLKKKLDAAIEVGNRVAGERGILGTTDPTSFWAEFEDLRYTGDASLLEEHQQKAAKLLQIDEKDRGADWIEKAGRVMDDYDRVAGSLGKNMGRHKATSSTFPYAVRSPRRGIEGGYVDRYPDIEGIPGFRDEYERAKRAQASLQSNNPIIQQVSQIGAGLVLPNAPVSVKLKQILTPLLDPTRRQFFPDLLRDTIATTEQMFNSRKEQGGTSEKERRDQALLQTTLKKLLGGTERASVSSLVMEEEHADVVARGMMDEAEKMRKRNPKFKIGEYLFGKGYKGKVGHAEIKGMLMNLPDEIPHENMAALPPGFQEALQRENQARLRMRVYTSDYLRKRRPDILEHYADSLHTFEPGTSIGQNQKVTDASGRIIQTRNAVIRPRGPDKDLSFRDISEKVENNAPSSNQTLSNAFKRVALWGTASGVVYGLIRAIGSMAQVIKQTEVNMIELQKVMNPATTDFGKLRDSAVGFAKEFGTSVNTVLDSFVVFAKQGLGQSEVLERGRTSVLAGNVTEGMKPEKATEILTSALKQFPEEGGDALRFLDSLNEVANRFAVTETDLGDSLLRAGASAKVAGVSFDEFLGLTTALVEVTRKTGRETGTSLNYMLRSLYRPKSRQALAEIGIPVVDAKGLRTATDILKDLSTVFDSLSAEQKLNVVEATVGTRRYNDFAVILHNFDTALSATAASANSQGSAMRENQLVMESYAKKVEVLKASTDALAIKFGDVLLPVAKAVVATMTGMVHIFTEIPNSVKIATAAAASLLIVLGKIQEIKWMTGDLLGGASPLKLFSNLKIGLATGLEKVIPMLTSNTKLLGGTVAALALLFTDVGDAAKKTFSNLKDDIDSLLDSKLKIGLTGESTEKKLNLSIFKEEDTSSRSALASARLAKTGQAFLKSYNLEKAGPEGTAEALSKISEGTFESPLAIRKKALIEQQSIINEVARINLDLVDSYDKQGNAILKTNNLLSIQLDLVKSLSDTAIAFSKIKIAEGFANDLGNLSNNWDIMRQRFKELLSHFGAGGRYLEKQIDTKPINALNYYTNRMEVLTDKRKTGDKSVDPEMRELQTKIAEAQTDVDTILNRIYENLIPASKNLAPSDVLTKLSSDANKNALTEFSRRELAKEGALTGSAYDKINAVDTRAKENLAALVFSQFGIPTRGTTSGRGIAEKYMEAGLTPKGISEGRAAPSNRDVITFSDEIADKLGVAAKFAVYIGDRFQSLGKDNEITSFTTDQFNEAMSSVADNAQSKFVMMFSNVARDTETLFEAAVKEARRISTGAGFGISFPGDINTGARLEKELEPQLRLYRTFGNNLISIRGEDAGGKRENFLDIVRKQQETLKSRKEALGLTKEGGRNSQFDSEEVDNLVKISGASRKAVTDLQETLANNSAIITFSQEIQSLGDVLNNVADSIRERRELLQFKEFDERNYLTGGRNRPPIDLGTRRINLSPFERQVQGGGGITSLVDNFNETKALVSDFSSAGQNAVKSKLLVQNIIRDFTKAGISPDTKSLEEVGAAAKSGNLGQYENKELALKSIEVNKDIFTESARTNEILEIIAKNTVEGFTEKDKDARVKSLQSKLPQTFQAVDKAAKEGDFSTLTSIISNVFTSGGIPEKTKLAIRDAIIERTREVGDRTIQAAPLETTQGRNMKDALESKLADLAALTPGGDKTTDPIKFRANLGEFEKLTLAILDNIISSTKAQASELASSGDRLTTILDGLKATIDAVLGAVEGGFNSILSTFNQLSTAVATPSIGVGELAGFKNVNPSIDLRRRKEDLSPEERLFSSRQEDVFSVNILNSALQESGTMLTGLKDKLVQFSKEGRSQAERNVLSNTIRDIQSAREDMTDQLKILADSLSKGLDIQKMISSLESLRKQLDTFKIDKDNSYSKASYDIAQGLQPRQLLDGTNGQKYFGSAGLTASQQEVERTQKKHPSIIDDRNASLAKEAADEARRLKENQEELARQQSVGEEARKVAIEGVRLNVPGSKALLNDINAELAGSGRIVGEKNHVPEFAGIDLEGSAIDRGIRSLTLELEKTKANTNAEAIAGKLGGTFKDLFSNFILAEDALFQRSDSVAIANTDRMVDILQQIVKNANNGMAGGVIPSGGATGGAAGGVSAGVPGAAGTIFASNGGPMYTGVGGRYYNTSGYQIVSGGVKAAGIGIAGSLSSSISPSSSAFNIPDMLSPESALIDGIYDIKGPVLPPSTINSSNPLASKAFTMPSFSSGVDVTTAGLTNDVARTVPLMTALVNASSASIPTRALRVPFSKTFTDPKDLYRMSRSYLISRRSTPYNKIPEFVPTETGITTPTNPVGPRVRESIPKLNEYLEEVRDAFFPKPDPNLNWPENVYTSAAGEGRAGAAIAREAAAVTSPAEGAATKLGFFRRMGRYMGKGASAVGGITRGIPGGAIGRVMVPVGIVTGGAEAYNDFTQSRKEGSNLTMASWDATMGQRRRTAGVPATDYVTNTAYNVLRPSGALMAAGGILGGLVGGIAGLLSPVPGGAILGMGAGATKGAAIAGGTGLILGAAGEATNQVLGDKTEENPVRDMFERTFSPDTAYFRQVDRRRHAIDEEIKVIDKSIEAGQDGNALQERRNELLKKKEAAEFIIGHYGDYTKGVGDPLELYNAMNSAQNVLGVDSKHPMNLGSYKDFSSNFSDSKEETRKNEAASSKEVDRGLKDISKMYRENLVEAGKTRESSGPASNEEITRIREKTMHDFAARSSFSITSPSTYFGAMSDSSSFKVRNEWADRASAWDASMFHETRDFTPRPPPQLPENIADKLPNFPYIYSRFDDTSVSSTASETFDNVRAAFEKLEEAAASSGVTLEDVAKKSAAFKFKFDIISSTLGDLQKFSPRLETSRAADRRALLSTLEVSPKSMARPLLGHMFGESTSVQDEGTMQTLKDMVEKATKEIEKSYPTAAFSRERADKAVKSAADAVSLDTSTMSLVPSPDKSTIKDGTSIVGGPRKGTGGGLEALKGLYSSEGFNPDQIGNKLNNFFDNLILELRNKNVSDEILKKLSPDMSFPSIINTVREDAQGANLFGAANASLLSGNRRTGSYFEDIMLANDRARRPAIGLSNTTGANNTLSIINEANGTSYGLQRYGAVARRDPEIDKMAYTVNIPSKKLSKETENAYFTGNVDVETRNRQLAALGKLSEGEDSPFAGLGLSGSGQLVTRTPSEIRVEDSNLGEIYGNNDFQKAKVGQATFGLLQSDGTKLPTPIDPFGMKGALATSVANSTALQPSVQALVRSVGPSGISPTSAFGDTVTGTNLANNGVIAAFAAGTTGKAKDDYTKNIDTVKAFGLDKTFEQLGGTFKYSGGGQKAFLGGKEISAENFAKFTQHGLDSEAAKPLADLLGVKAAGLDGKTSTDKEAEGATTADGKKAQAPELTVSKIIVQTEITTPAIKAGSLQISGDESKKSKKSNTASAAGADEILISSIAESVIQKLEMPNIKEQVASAVQIANDATNKISAVADRVREVTAAVNAANAIASTADKKADAAFVAASTNNYKCSPTPAS